MNPLYRPVLGALAVVVSAALPDAAQAQDVSHYISQPRYPGTEHRLAAISNAYGMCRLLGYQSAVQGSVEDDQPDAEPAVVVNSERQVIGVAPVPARRVVCLNQLSANSPPPRLVRIPEDPGDTRLAHPGSGLAISVQSNVHGVCRTFGQRWAVPGSFQATPDSASTSLIVDVDGRVLKLLKDRVLLHGLCLEY